MILQNTDVAILCGGRGSRLHSLTTYTPKCLLPIMGRPFLDWLMDWLEPHGPRSVTLCTGYLHEEVQIWAKGRKLALSRDPTPLKGEIPALVDAPLSSDPVLVMNGDTYVDADLGAFLKVYEPPATSLWVRRFGKPDRQDTGIRLLSQEFLADLKEADETSLTLFLRGRATRAFMKGIFYDYGTSKTYNKHQRFFGAYV